MSLSLKNLQCNFSGRDVNVKIHNDTGRYETVEFECEYEMTNGDKKLLHGSRGISPGKTETVAQDRLPAPVRKVTSKSIIEK